MAPKKQGEQTKQKQPYRHREQTDVCQVGGRLGGWVKNVKGIKKNKLMVIKTGTEM